MSIGVSAVRRPRLLRARLRLSRQRVRLLVAVALLAALGLGGGWFVLRDSSLVGVQRVTVWGADGPNGPAVQARLASVARTMTTLDVQTQRLRAAVRGFPEVTGLRARAEFPHGLVIAVIERVPVAVVDISGRSVPVTADGRLLPGTAIPRTLPLIAISQPPPSDRLEQAWARGAARILAAAPYQMVPKLSQASVAGGHGLAVQIRNGPIIYFGDADDPHAKWSSVLAVLADPGSAGASYIDVTDPVRPAAGTTAATAAATTVTATTAAATTAAVAGSSTPGGATTGAGGPGLASATTGPTAAGATPASAAASTGGLSTPTGG